MNYPALDDLVINRMTHAFPYAPTPGQIRLIQTIGSYLNESDSSSVLMVKGYAGTGKTTVLSTLVKIIPELGLKSVLLAPTGRAAKVFTAYSGIPAQTIHRKIYMVTSKKGGVTSLSIRPNQHKKTVFIVDEASMITNTQESSSDNMFGERLLLDDLIRFVHASDGCRLILVGDTAQLPPVNSPESPALQSDYIVSRFGLKVVEEELTEVVRQSETSGILVNATEIRNNINNEIGDYSSVLPIFNCNTYPDINSIKPVQLEEILYECLAKFGQEGTIVLCRSNKQANYYNKNIRSRMLQKEGEMDAGDYVMVVRNNYFWLDDDSEAGFIANGDIGELLRVKTITERYGFRFADVELKLLDFPENPPVSCKVMLDSLMSETASIPYLKLRQLFDEISKDYSEISNIRSRNEAVRNDPFYNALQLKFAYAVTCHKSQGGQWKSVFVDPGYFKPEQLDREYLRWIYTAVTRASEQLYLINFPDICFTDH